MIVQENVATPATAAVVVPPAQPPDGRLRSRGGAVQAQREIRVGGLARGIEPEARKLVVRLALARGDRWGELGFDAQLTYFAHAQLTTEDS